MHYKTIYEIASSPVKAIEQLVLGRFHEPDAVIILLGFPIVMAWLLWMRKANLKRIILGMFGGEITLILCFSIWFIGFCYPEHMQLAQVYANGKSEEIEGQITNLRQAKHDGKTSFEAASFTVNGKEINFSTRNPGFNDPFDKNIQDGSKVHIWLTTEPRFKQVILRLDVAREAAN